MEGIYTKINRLKGWLMVLSACWLAAAGLQAQVGLVWAASDYGTVPTMASSAQEIAFDMVRTEDTVYVLVGRSDALDEPIHSLFLYAYPTATGSNPRKVKLAESTTTNSTKFLIPGTLCGDGKSLTAPRKLHLERYNGDFYVAGTLTGNVGASFPAVSGLAGASPKPLIPLSASGAPIMFLSRFDINGNIQGYTLVSPSGGVTPLGDGISFVSDMDIDASTGAIYLLGYHREKSACDSTVYYEPPPIDYTPIEYEPIEPCCKGQLALRPSNTSGASTGGLKSNSTLALNFLPSTPATVISSAAPSNSSGNSGALGYTCSTTNNLGELNFMVSYNPTLAGFYSPPVPVMGTKTQGGTVLATSLTFDDGFIYIGGHFSRPKDYCIPQSLTGAIPGFDTIMSPSLIKNNNGSDYKFAQNAFVAKFTKSATPTLLSEQRILGSASQSIHDILVKDDKVLVLLQASKVNVFGDDRDTVAFRTLNYSTNTTLIPYSYYDYNGTKVKSGLFLLQLSNSSPIPTKEARVERYLELSSLNPAVPYSFSDNIQIDANNDLFIALTYSGNLDVMPNARLAGYQAPTMLASVAASSGRSDVAVVKYNSAWQFQWARSVGGSLSEGMPSLRPTNDGGFFLAGAFQGLTDFEPAPQKSFIISSKGNHDAFVAKYGCYDLNIQQLGTVACAGTPMRLYADVSCPGDCAIDYIWGDPATNAQFFAGGEYTFVPSVGTNVRTIIGNDVNTGCVMYDTLEIVANPEVIVTAQPATSLICAGESIVFSASSNQPNTRYEWYYGNGLTPVDTSNAVLAANAGVYRVEANANGCKASATSLLNQYTPQRPHILPDTALLCGGQISLEVTGCPGCDFNWAPPLGAGSSSTTNQIQATVHGTYVVNVIDNNGCSYLLNKEVTTAPYLLPSIVARNTNDDYVTAICNNSPLIVETLPYCPTCTYRWNNGSTANFTFAFTGGNYQVTVTNNATGCSGVSNILGLSNVSLATPSIVTIPAQICTDQSLTTPAVLEVANPCPGCYYRWYTNDQTQNTVVDIGTSIPVTAPGDYILRVTDTLNCSEFSTAVTIGTDVVSTPVITTNHDRICGSNSAKLSTSPCAGCSYQWYQQSTSGNTLSAISGAVGNEYTTQVSGTYFVEVTYANTCQRFSAPVVIQSGSFAIALNKTAGLPKYVCDGEPVLLSISGAYELPPNWAYQWMRNGVDIAGATGYNYNTTQAGYYTLRVTDQDSCVAISNIDTVYAVSAGSNPVLTADPTVLCTNQFSLLTVVTEPCSTCVYGWRLDNNALEAYTSVSSYSTSNKRGYYAVVIDRSTGCYYLSNVIQLRDTSLPTPTLVALNNPTCSPLGVGVVLSTAPESGAQYIWYYGLDSAITNQNTFVATSYSGPYSVRIKKGDCLSPPSNDVPVSFSSFSAQLFSSTSPIICNGTGVLLFTTPKRDPLDPPSAANICSSCNYRWYNDGVQLSTGNLSTYTATSGGNYFAVISATSGCMDTTNIITITEANTSTILQTSTTQAGDSAYVCGATNPTRMSVGACVGCTYAWYYGVASYATANLVSTQTDTAYTVVGGASAGYYIVDINNNGCIQRDSVRLVAVAPFFDAITVAPSHGNICAGTPVSLTGGPNAVQRRWMRNGLPIPGILAEQPSYQTTIGAVYNLIATDSRGCIDTTDAVTLIESNPAAGFALNFNSINPVPITTPAINLDNYLQPSSIHNGRGRYTSLTATSAIDTASNTFNPSIAGAGLHIVYYHDTVGACVFTVSDTIEILQSTNVDIQNRRLANLAAGCPSAGCPAYEACLQDSMRIILTNFPFVPSSVRFMTDTGYYSVNVIPVLNPVGSVWSGYIPVNVPNHARTGKLRLVNGSDIFQTSFFLVVQNPAVSMDLQGVTQPLCSNNPAAALTAVPVSGATGVGTFTAAYAAAPNTAVPSLLSSSAPYNPISNPVGIVVSNIAGYSLTGRQDLVVTYSFQPVYTGTTITCPSAIKDTMHIEVRNVDLTGIEYTPVSMTQSMESMFNLTRLVYPLSSRVYAGHYTGTYINADNVLPVTISAGWGPQPVTYHISNSSCANAVTDTVDVWPAPSLAVIPDYVCRKAGDTIWIGRDPILGPYVTRNGTTTYYDPQYSFAYNTVSTVDYGYTEHVNSMTLSSSAGGLIPFNNANGQERYALVPSVIAGNTTTLTLTYRYYRTTNYFDATSAIDPSDTSSYTIASIQRTVNFEDLPAVLINPAILADPVFCKENTFIQFSGTPNGGQYYVFNGAGTNIRSAAPARVIDTLQNNLFNPQDYLTPNPVTNLQLRYVFAGNACKDSAQTTIGIAAPFAITLTSSSAPTFCEEEPNDLITITSSIQAPNALDSTSGLFYVGGVQSGQVFSPSLRGPGVYPVSYTVSDIYGCQAKDSTTFTVNPTPALTMTALAPIYCANDPVIPMTLFSNGVDITAAYAGNIVTLVGGGIINGGTSMASPSGTPAYYPLQSTGTRRDTTLRDTVTYTLVDPNGCTATIQDYMLIRELPALALTLPGGEAIPSSFCEGDTAQIIGLPIGGTFANVVTNPTGHTFSLNASTGLFTPFISGPTPNSITEEYLYTFANNATGCRDTIRDTITILNRAEVTITGLPSLSCASDTTFNLGITSIGAPVTTGIFSAFPASAVRMDNPSTPSAFFYPDSAGITFSQNTIRVRLSYVSNGCNSRAEAFITLNPLPQLSFNTPGDTLAGGGIDRRFHICESADSVPLYAYNFYNGSNLPIFPETGVFTARGVRYFGAPTNRYIYFARDAVFGPDTIVYRYTDPRGCTNTDTNLVVVDTVPALGFAGFSPSRQIGSNPDTFSYCANDAAALIVPSPFGGLFSFQSQLQQNGVFNFDPAQLSTPTPTIYELSYTYIARRYTNGRVCQDSIKNYVEVKPIPILNFVGVPNQICVSSAADQFTLHATPVGGVFRDNTPNILGGILADTIFDPMAQFGRRNILYWYTDPATNCADTIQHNIDVYRIPLVDFATGGGCEGDPITFVPGSTGLVNTPPAADSITMYIWNYGDGVIDTTTNITDPEVLPNRSYAYAAAGIFFPQLTVVNRYACADSAQVRIVVSPKVAITPALPYIQTFNDDPGNWFQETVNNPNPVDSLWQWGLATGTRITTANEQNNVWVTRANGVYLPGDRGWVYSPCFDISALHRPMFAMDAWIDTREGVDGAAVEFYHPTKGWTLLGERNKGINWYDSLYLISAPGIQVDSTQYAPLGWSGLSESFNGFESVRYRLDVNTRNGDLRGMQNVRFRVSFAAADNTDAAGREGFAFDNVYIGERTRSVLVEHFSNQNITGISSLENRLYQLIYSNLYGRDVTLLQYQTDFEGADLYFSQAQAETESRGLYYSLSDSRRLRVNGLNPIAHTQDLVNNVDDAQEYLDMQMLTTPLFKITIPAVPQIFQVATGAATGQAVAAVEIEALQPVEYDNYIIHAVITEDSLRSTQRHYMMSVVRRMLADASLPTAGTSGTPIDAGLFPLAAGDVIPLTLNWEFATSTYRRQNLRLNVFIQNVATKEVLQVATSRNLTVFNGPVNVEELTMAEGKEIIDFKLYPNPAQDYFNVEFDQPLEGEYDWQVVDMLGRVLDQGKAQPGDRSIQVRTAEYAAGMYIFSIHNETVYSQRQAIIARP